MTSDESRRKTVTVALKRLIVGGVREGAAGVESLR